jgi:hypothetical protein
MMTARKLAAFRLDEELVEGLKQVWERDGIQPSEQVRRAVKAWLKEKGLITEKSDRKRAGTRKRP